jgi:tubulin beta
MGDIIHIQFGQSGNQIGDRFWSLLREEHLLDTKGKPQENAPASVHNNMGVFFHEQSENKFVPRALLVDLGKCLSCDCLVSLDMLIILIIIPVRQI